MGYTFHYPALLAFFTKHVDEIINTADIAIAINATELQVKGAINTLLGHGHDIESVSRGAAYVYRGMKSEIKKTTPGKRMFEEIGTGKNGIIVIQDTEGNLYKAEEI